MNKGVLQVSQDALGQQGALIREVKAGTVWYQIYRRKLHNGDVAVALFNRGAEQVTEVHFTWEEVGVPGGKGVNKVHDIWADHDVSGPAGAAGCTWPVVEVHDTVLLRVVVVV